MTGINRKRLPTFLIIGAPKTGTTSLHFYLDQHPQVSMSSPKETDFFERADYLETLGEYERCFQEGFDARGEASPRYACFPCWNQIPERISSVLPDAKLIYLVRDPIERAIAHYYERLASNAAPKSIIEAFSELDSIANDWIWASKYALQVDQYMRHFQRTSLLIVDSDDLRVNRQATLRSIFIFLEVDSAFSSPTFSKELNTRDTKMRMTHGGHRLRFSPAAKAARRTLPPSVRAPLFAALRKSFLRRVKPQPFPDEARERLKEHLREDTERFRSLAGKPFEHWSI